MWELFNMTNNKELEINQKTKLRLLYPQPPRWKWWYPYHLHIRRLWVGSKRAGDAARGGDPEPWLLGGPRSSRRLPAIGLSPVMYVQRDKQHQTLFLPIVDRENLYKGRVGDAALDLVSGNRVLKGLPFAILGSWVCHFTSLEFGFLISKVRASSFKMLHFCYGKYVQD